MCIDSIIPWMIILNTLRYTLKILLSLFFTKNVISGCKRPCLLKILTKRIWVNCGLKALISGMSDLMVKWELLWYVYPYLGSSLLSFMHSSLQPITCSILEKVLWGSYVYLLSEDVFYWQRLVWFMSIEIFSRILASLFPLKLEKIFPKELIQQI